MKNNHTSISRSDSFEEEKNEDSIQNQNNEEKYRESLESAILAFNEKKYPKALEELRNCIELESSLTLQDHKVETRIYIERCHLKLKPIVWMGISDFKLEEKDGEKIFRLFEIGNTACSGLSDYGTKILNNKITLEEKLFNPLEKQCNLKSFAYFCEMPQEAVRNLAIDLDKTLQEDNENKNDYTKISFYKRLMLSNSMTFHPSIKKYKDNPTLLKEGFFGGTLCAEDKERTHRFFNPKYRPPCVRISKGEKLSEEEFNKIDALKGDYILVKEPQGNEGKNVHLVLKNRDSINQKINEIALQENSSKEIKSPYLLIEQIIYSKPVKANDKLYEHTERAIWMLTKEGDKYDFHLIDIFGKLARVPIDNEDLRNRIISNTQDDRLLCGISKEDYKSAEKQISEGMLEAFKKMIDMNSQIWDETERLLKSDHLIERKEGLYLATQLRDVYLFNENYVLCQYYENLIDHHQKQKCKEEKKNLISLEDYSNITIFKPNGNENENENENESEKLNNNLLNIAYN